MRATTSSAAERPAERRPRSDGAEARKHLLLSALRLFSQKGFADTSTREIAQAAGTNIASISYYFGDKAGLYRAVFAEPMGMPCDDIGRFLPEDLSLRQSMEGFIASFLEPIKQGDLAQQLTRLHFREMLEPTGLWAEQIEGHIKPAHAALVQVLCRHLELKKADDDVHRLAFSITGLAMQIFVTRDVIEAIRPELLGHSRAIETWASRMADFAEAMVEADRARRSASATRNKTAKPSAPRAALARDEPGNPKRAKPVKKVN